MTGMNMAIKGASPELLRSLAQWLDQPLTAAKEKALNEWLADDPEHQLSWDRLIKFNVSAKNLQIVPSEVAPEWVALRNELGFEHSSKRKSRRGARTKKRPLFRAPLFIAFLSTTVFALFLLVLYLIRSASAF